MNLYPKKYCQNHLVDRSLMKKPLTPSLNKESLTAKIITSKWRSKLFNICILVIIWIINLSNWIFFTFVFVDDGDSSAFSFAGYNLAHENPLKVMLLLKYIKYLDTYISMLCDINSYAVSISNCSFCCNDWCWVELLLITFLILSCIWTYIIWTTLNTSFCRFIYK